MLVAEEDLLSACKRAWNAKHTLLNAPPDAVGLEELTMTASRAAAKAVKLARELGTAKAWNLAAVAMMDAAECARQVADRIKP